MYTHSMQYMDAALTHTICIANTQKSIDTPKTPNTLQNTHYTTHIVNIHDATCILKIHSGTYRNTVHTYQIPHTKHIPNALDKELHKTHTQHTSQCCITT